MTNKITIENKKIIVPDTHVIPFMESNGIRKDISDQSLKVIDTAVQKAYESAICIN